MVTTEFEFEVKLKDGRRVSVSGQANVLLSCDCGTNPHYHIHELDIEDVTPLFEAGCLDGPEIHEGTYEWAQIEAAAERHVYRNMEEVA